MIGKEFKVNEYIALKLEDGKTFIYLGGKKFLQCMRLVLNIPVNHIADFDEVNSIDDAVDVSKHLYQNQIVEGLDALPVLNRAHSITPEVEFWGHCANVQAWAETSTILACFIATCRFPY